MCKVTMRLEMQHKTNEIFEAIMQRDNQHE